LSTPEKSKRAYPHPLMGAGLLNLFRLFRRYGWPGRGHRMAAPAFILSALFRVPFMLTDKAVVAMKGETKAPQVVFILGHWRCGTTHLYNVMSKSPRFQFVNPYQAALPGEFLSLTKAFRPFLRKSLPKGRTIDEVPVTEDSPQEDEFALANLMPYSFLHALYFPKDFFETFNQGLFFEGLSDEEVKDWQRKLNLFYQKLQIAGPGKTILIKNPPYTTRVGLLKKMFPKAKFIHIHRNPYKVFFSMRNFYDQLLGELSLQGHDVGDLDDHILSVFKRMMDDLEKETADLPPDRFISLPFVELQEKPLEALKKVYEQLDLGDFDEDKGHYEDYLKGIEGYKKNVYDFPEEDLKKVEIHWRKFIKQEGYRRP